MGGKKNTVINLKVEKYWEKEDGKSWRKFSKKWEGIEIGKMEELKNWGWEVGKSRISEKWVPRAWENLEEKIGKY